MSSASRRKVLLMGKSGSGKTSMRSVIFVASGFWGVSKFTDARVQHETTCYVSLLIAVWWASLIISSNYTAKDTRRLGATIDVEQSAVRLLGSLVLDAFLESYLQSQRDTIFSNVAVLIYVFDITIQDWEKDLHYFEDNLRALRENSPDSGVWVLINKMDLADKVDPSRQRYQERRSEILEVNKRVNRELADVEWVGELRCFPTSIWDESLYKAWSSVIHTLIPNITLITHHLTFLRDLCQAAEAVAFEAETFLVIAKSGSELDSDDADLDAHEKASGITRLDKQRFERISEIIKNFRRTMMRTGETFSGFEATFDGLRIVLEPLTRNTFLMIVGIDPHVYAGMIKYIIHQSQMHLVEVGLTKDTQPFTRKCGICKDVISRLMPQAKYEPRGADNPSVRAWDDIGPIDS